MNKEINNQDFIQKELAKYSLTDAEIAKMKEKAFSLKVANSEDIKNYDLAKSAHQEIKKVRVNIEKKRKELKASSLEFGRKVDAEAKRLTGRITEIENYLLDQRKIVEDEKERIRKQREEEIRAEEERKKREEEERLEKIRQEQEAKEKELKEKEEAMQREQEERERKIREEQEQIEAEKRKIEEEKARQEREKINALYEKRLEIAMPFKQFWSTERYDFGTMSETNFQSVMSDLKDRKEAHDMEVEADRAKAEVERIAAEKAESERQEALKPDMQKVREYAQKIVDIEIPELQTKDAYELLDDAHVRIIDICKELLNAKI